MPRTLEDFASPSTVECAYCSHDVPAADATDAVPPIDDDDAWTDRAKHHLPSCEWILTRAHRRDVEILTPADTAEIERKALAAAASTPSTYLVLGAGKSSVRAIHDADQDEDNWVLARVLFARQMRETEQTGDRWCVLVSGVTESELDADHATIAHREIRDFDLALGAARGVNAREQSEIAAAKAAMSAAGAI